MDQFTVGWYFARQNIFEDDGIVCALIDDFSCTGRAIVFIKLIIIISIFF